MDESTRQILIAVIDRIIPQDDFPSASEAGVMGYLEPQLHTGAAVHLPIILAGLRGLDATARKDFGCGFAELSAEQQDALLMQIENEPFFQRLIELTAEGFYAEPQNGGNLGEISWKMIGFLPRVKGDLA